MPTDRQKLAVENLRAAYQGRPAGALAAVVAGDVVEAAALVAEPDGIVAALRDGAAAAKPAETVYQIVWQVSHLVGKTGL